MSDEAQSAERLLLKAATSLLAADQREETESFNLFTVLRSGSDEVHLHSRFLHALLAHRTQGRRKNLEAFLKLECLQLGDVASLNVDAAEVHRETAVEGERIDLWIADRSSGYAVAIENKIYAGDQANQLQRYYCALRRAKFHDVRIIYLTLDGHEPSRDSQGKTPDGELSCVSYEDLLPWLGACHDQEQGDPALRSSVAQYRQLVRQLTGGGLGGNQMAEMKKIIRESGSLALARHLGTAADDLFVDIVHELWKEIDEAVQKELQDEGISCGVPSAIDCERIRQAFGLSDRRRNLIRWHGLYYPFKKQNTPPDLAPAPALGIEINGGREFFFGVRCRREDSEELRAEKVAYGAIKLAVSTSPQLAGKFVQDDDPWWPCWRYVLGDRGLLTYGEAAKLADSKEQKTLAKRIADQCKELWNYLKKGEGTRDLF